MTTATSPAQPRQRTSNSAIAAAVIVELEVLRPARRMHKLSVTGWMRGVGAGVALVAVQDAVSVAIDAEPHAGPGRRAGVRHLLAPELGEGPECEVGHGR